jgi:hypothetical protein
MMPKIKALICMLMKIQGVKSSVLRVENKLLSLLKKNANAFTQRQKFWNC